ncbi:MAG: hypothetical protein CVV05_00245 [Gammaproteobacteria bacterium HGW-Gammaproteobacteria-1]|jgi:hypothetical protein|nr:MAG: hypothetical protein CVV05_00245 [Gammaproteobacteria bacterium HGW-Gammaproteobacteria-1]
MQAPLSVGTVGFGVMVVVLLLILVQSLITVFGKGGSLRVKFAIAGLVTSGFVLAMVAVTLLGSFGVFGEWVVGQYASKRTELWLYGLLACVFTGVFVWLAGRE